MGPKGLNFFFFFVLVLRGLLLEEKPELQRVLQQRRLDLHREQELALQPPSDLEQELRKRQQKLQEVQTNICPQCSSSLDWRSRVLPHGSI